MLKAICQFYQWLRVRWRWIVAIVAVAAILAMVVVAFKWRDDFACWIGYAAMVDGGLNRGGRFFRDFVIAITIIGIGAWLWRSGWWQHITAKVRNWFCAQKRLIAVVKWLCAYWGWVVAVVAVVVIAFAGRDYFACWIGYTAMADAELNRGGRFFRDFVIALAAIVGIAIAAWRTAALDRQTKTAEDNLRLSEKRLLGERLATVMELLVKETTDDKPAIAARVSGMHIMETMVKSAPKELAEEVVKYLVAYIRGHAQLTAEPPLEKDKTPDKPRMLGEDVKTAFAVLHNILSNKTIKAGIDKGVLDALLDFSHQNFSGLDLGYPHVNLCHYKKWVGADLTSSRLFYANLKGANLSYAILKSAYMNCAFLTDANLSRAEMAEAKLREADLRGAEMKDVDLSGSDLREAQMQGVNLLDASFKDAWKNEDRASLEFARLDGARLEGVNLRDARMSKASLKGAFILDSKLNKTNFRNATMTEVHFGDTRISCKEFSPAESPEVKAMMDGKVWHSGADWAQGIRERPADAEWDLTQYKDGYALAGVLENFAKYNDSEFNSINLRQQARKLMDDGKLPKSMPQEWREWLAKIDPATGLTSGELAFRGLAETMRPPPEMMRLQPEQEETTRTKQK